MRNRRIEAHRWRAQDAEWKVKDYQRDIANLEASLEERRCNGRGPGNWLARLDLWLALRRCHKRIKRQQVRAAFHRSNLTWLESQS